MSGGFLIECSTPLRQCLTRRNFTDPVQGVVLTTPVLLAGFYAGIFLLLARDLQGLATLKSSDEF